MKLSQLIEAYKERYLELAERDYEQAFELAIRDLGLARHGQSTGYHRIGTEVSTLEIIEPPSVEDPHPVNG